MHVVSDSNNPGLSAGQHLLGYTLKRVVHLRTIDAIYYDLEHRATGTRHGHLSNADPDNTFSVAFKTVPQDSTGVAHILEHTALCGSHSYPVRDPFFSMLKRSLSTFMNAFTASDWTMYPFCTQNEKDFYNLLAVYLDAAFFPNLDALSFKQEGHRLELEAGDDNDTRLAYKGVVFNEMKGAMSSPDQVMVRSMLNALYPDTTYRFNSGGEPAVIPHLTHEQLKAFHHHHYHPSNAYFYTYGNLPLTPHLAFIEAHVLGRFDRIEPGTHVPCQPRWDQPREAMYTYPLEGGDDITRKYQACVAWLVPDIRETYEVLVMSVLEQVLLGNAASPLRKALMDSGLGSALSDGSGYDADNRDTLFACGLKDVDQDAAGPIETIVFDCLRALDRDGIDPDLVASALHQIEFYRKEVTNVPYPYGLKLLLSFAGSWFHDADPVRILDLDADLARFRRDMTRPRFLEERLKRYLLSNPHRVRLTLKPDPEKTHRENVREAAELSRIESELSATDLEQIVTDTQDLEQLQDAQEDVSVLPTLERTDIPPDVQRVSALDHHRACAPVLYARKTAGIDYLSAAAGTAGLPPEMIDWVPFLCYALPRIGTQRRSYIEMARRIDRYTGGIGLGAQAASRLDAQGECIPFVALNGKCLARNRDYLYDILLELTGSFDFADTARLKQLLLEYRAGLEAMVIQNGHRLAISLAGRNFSVTTALSEQWQGVHQLKFIKAATEDLNTTALQQLSARLNDTAGSLFSAGSLNIALIGEDPEAAIQAPALGRLSDALATNSGIVPAVSQPLPPVEIPAEGWTTASAVSFVARAFQTVRMHDPEAPVLAVTAKLLRSLYLHREIREKGGAYGGFALYSPDSGVFAMASYRDPHIVATLNAFDGALEFIRSGDYADEDVKEAILQVCSEIDKPDPPGPAARKAFYRKLIGLSDEQRVEFKQRLLAVDPQAVARTAKRFFADGAPAGATCVISSQERIREANAKLAPHQLAVAQI